MIIVWTGLFVNPVSQHRAYFLIESRIFFPPWHVVSGPNRLRRMVYNAKDRVLHTTKEIKIGSCGHRATSGTDYMQHAYSQDQQGMGETEPAQGPKRRTRRSARASRKLTSITTKSHAHVVLYLALEAERWDPGGSHRWLTLLDFELLSFISIIRDS